MTHRINRRQLFQLTVGSATAYILTACAPTGSPAASSDEPSAETGTAVGEVEFWDWNYAPRADYMAQVVATFEENNPGVSLNYNIVGSYSDAETRLLTAGTSGTGPPFANVHNFWRVDLQRAGVLVPYPDDLFEFDQLYSTPFNRDPQTGEIYTSDFALYTDQVFFNQALFDEQGISTDEIPRNWDDFLRMAEQLTVRDSSGTLQQAGWAFNHYYSREWLWTSMVYQQGAFLYNEDGTEALWNSEAGVNALQLIQDIYYRYQIDDPDFLGMGDAFGTGRAAMMLSQGYWGGDMDNSYPDVAGQWGTAVTPTFTGEPLPAWGLVTPEEGMCVFSNAPEETQEIAFNFIQEMLGGEERRVEWALVSNGPSDREDLREAPAIQEREQANSISTQAETLPYRINYGERPLEAERIWRTMFDTVILNQESPQAALDDATEQMNAVFRETADVRRLFTERNYQPPSS